MNTTRLTAQQSHSNPRNWKVTATFNREDYPGFDSVSKYVKSKFPVEHTYADSFDFILLGSVVCVIHFRVRGTDGVIPDEMTLTK